MANTRSSSAAPTLLCVHAHPDDEATSTGGILARYAAEGVRTVLVTCTNGECGDGPGGVKPGEPGHDPEAVAATRRAELEESCRILGVDHLELLGFRDSGMDGWPQNDDPRSFWRTPLDVAVGRLAPLLDRYRPDVVVTYDADGFYGHPDHVQAHRLTVAALGEASSPARLYFPVIPASARARFAEMFAEAAAGEGAAGEAAAGEGAAGEAAAGEGAAATRGPAAGEGAGRAESGERAGRAESGERAGSARGAGSSENAGGSEGAEGGDFDYRSMNYPDDELAAVVDCRLAAKTAFYALAAHESQSENAFMLRLGPDRFADWFGIEAFAWGRDDRARPPRLLDDLFAPFD